MRRGNRVEDDPFGVLGREIQRTIERSIDGERAAASEDEQPNPRSFLYLAPGNERRWVTRDALGAIGRELVKVARRLAAEAEARRRKRVAARQRVRRAATAAGVAILALSSAGVTAALVSNTTRIQALDRFLDLQDANRRERGATRPPGLGADPYADPNGLTREPLDVSDPIEVPWDGASSGRAVGYAVSGGELCVSILRSSSPDESSVGPAENLSRCKVERNVRDAIRGEGGYPALLTPHVLVGLVGADAERLRVWAPDGYLAVRVSAPWTPNDGAEALRAFAAMPVTFLDGPDLTSPLTPNSRAYRFDID